MAKKKIQEKRNMTVYMHITPDGKRYIGITSEPVEKRWGKNGIRYNTQYFWKAIQKFGWDNIKHKILYTGLTVEEAEDWEVGLIALWRTEDPEYGYNRNPGGKYTSKLTEEQRAKISAKLRGRRNRTFWKSVICLETMTIYQSITDAQRDIKSRHISCACYRRYKKKTCGGYHWAFYDENTPLWKYKRLLKQYIKEDEAELLKKNKPVICLETLKVYPSARDASRETGAEYSIISNCCNRKGRYNTTANYHWSFYDDSKSMLYYKEQLSQLKKAKKAKASVRCIETGQVFESVRDAKRKMNLPMGVHIFDCLQGRREMAGGYHWERYDENKKQRQPTQEIKVICLETLIIYDSIADACRDTGTNNKAHITDCCNGKRLTANGYHWVYYDESKPLSYYSELPKEVFHKEGRKVVQVETERIFRTAKDAGIECGSISGSHILDCCRGKRTTAYGYHWKYAEGEEI